MKKNIFSAIFMAMLMLVSVCNTSCQKEILNTNQYGEELSLTAFGPIPVARGGKLHVKGSALNTVKAVVFPGEQKEIEVTDFELTDNENIVVIVPREAQPGLLILKADGKTVKSTSRLSYTEPVDFAAEGAITPNPVKPGQKLTIKGSFLNLVQYVIFEKNVTVSVDNEHPTAILEQLEVVVPEEAKTGKISLAFVATGDTLVNEVVSKEVVNVVLPSVKAILELSETKPGDDVTIIGQDFDLVKKVLTPAGEELEYTVNEEYTEINIVLPENIGNGVINIVPASGVNVPVATIGVALPKQITMTPSENVESGATLTITGKDLDVVTDVEFPTSKATVVAEIVSRSATEIKVVLSADAISGSVILKTAAGINVTAETEPKLAYTTLKPSFKTYASNEVSLGGLVTITGFNMQLVAKVGFTGGAEVEEFVEQTNNVLKVLMPVAKVEDGALYLYMQNGESVEIPALKILLPEFCYMVDPSVLISTDDVEIKAATVIATEVENVDKLIGITIDGDATQYIVNGKTLYIYLLDKAGKNSSLTLISENGEITYPLSVIPNTDQKRAVWSGVQPLTWSDGGRLFLPASILDGVPDDAELVLCYTHDPVSEWANVQFCDGWWGKYASLIIDGKEVELSDGCFSPNNLYPDEPYCESHILLTKELKEHMLSHVGDQGMIVMQGANVVMSKVYISWTISFEQTLWTGPYVEAGWANWEFGKGEGENARMFADAGLHKGQVIRLYIEPQDGWGMKFYDGKWVGFNAADFGFEPTGTDASVINADNSPETASTGYVELKVSAEVAERLTSEEKLDWGMAWVMQGEFTLNKITIE